ncbi:hypothetical protein B0H19DRAFT_1184335 [Mycena capillaripes]|nr:hypothetical protein B0H19DRAFT_1184335 [Mycena capillaripes]
MGGDYGLRRGVLDTVSVRISTSFFYFHSPSSPSFLSFTHVPPSPSPCRILDSPPFSSPLAFPTSLLFIPTPSHTQEIDH